MKPHLHVVPSHGAFDDDLEAEGGKYEIGEQTYKLLEEARESLLDTSEWRHHKSVGGVFSREWNTGFSYSNRTDRERLFALEEKFEILTTTIRQLAERIAVPTALSERDRELGDSRLDWCEANLDELRRYPNALAAIHSERGIVAVSTDPIDFYRQLDLVDKDIRAHVLVIHTSQFV